MAFTNLLNTLHYLRWLHAGFLSWTTFLAIVLAVSSCSRNDDSQLNTEGNLSDSIASQSLCIMKGEHAGELTGDGRKQLSANRKELLPGEQKLLVELCPSEHYYPSGIIITPSATYMITAQGLWNDWLIPSGPNGWWFPPLQWNNRIRYERMFILSGSVGKTLEHGFVIGKRKTWEAPMKLANSSDWELYLFPNDWESAYGNNRALVAAKGGPMRVIITRLK